MDPKADDRAIYAHQVAQYVHVLRAKRGAIVYMTTGEIQWVESAPDSKSQDGCVCAAREDAAALAWQ